MSRQASLSTASAGVSNHEKKSLDESSKTCELEGDFPDGGWRAWTVVFGAWCGLTPTFAVMNIGGILEAWLLDHQLQGYSEATVSWIFSVWCFLLYMGGIVVGPVFDKYGIRYTVVPGAVGAVLSVMFLSVSTEYYQFLLGFGVLGGLSFSTLITPSLGCVTHWFNKKRGLATGLACTSGGIGGIVFTQVFSSLSPQIGFAWTIRVLGFICLLLCLLSILLLQTHLPSSSALPLNIDLRSIIHDPVFLLTSLSVVLAEAGLIIPVIYLPSYALSHGISTALSFQLMSIFNATSIVGRIIPGILADRIGRFNVMFGVSCVCTILAFGLWLNAAANRAAILSFVALCGFWSGPAISLSPVCVAQVCETRDYGKRYGTTSLLIGVVLLVIVPSAGEILRVQNDRTSESLPASTTTGRPTDYSGLICLCGAAYAGSAVCIFLARGMKVGWRPMVVF
ncbi:monocarboxylate permease [Aspergillus egyptiacus]|nr:monocarboxylate permease [Aspergillus egyptiacus]